MTQPCLLFLCLSFLILAQACDHQSDKDIVENNHSSRKGQLSECCSFCQSAPGCKAYVWTSHEGGTCWLKTATGPIVHQPGATVGILKQGCSQHPGKDIIENNHSERRGQLSDCCSFCQSTPGCKAYSWTNYQGGTCWLKTATGPLVDNGGSTVGIMDGNNVNPGSGGNTPYGQLAIKGKHLVQASTGTPVQLRGLSLFWHQWMGQFYNQATIKALKCSWNSNVVRAAIGVEMGGYLENKASALEKAYAVIDAAIAEGIYVIVDWHDHNAHQHRDQAIEFFTTISQKYGSKENIIYEIFNEPTQVSWSNDLKPYHIEVIKAIRRHDPKNVIIVGTPIWSQNVDDAANDPIQGFENIAYTLHFYAGTHKDNIRNKAKYAISKGLPIFVTEYGLVNADGNGEVNEGESNAWWNFLDENKISYLNWSVADKQEGASAITPGTTAEQVGDDSRLTRSGRMVKDKLKSQDNGVHC